MNLLLFQVPVETKHISSNLWELHDNHKKNEVEAFGTLKITCAVIPSKIENYITNGTHQSFTASPN